MINKFALATWQKSDIQYDQPYVMLEDRHENAYSLCSRFPKNGEINLYYVKYSLNS